MISQLKVIETVSIIRQKFCSSIEQSLFFVLALDYLTATVFNHLFPLNQSNRMINLHARGITGIQSKTFDNYHRRIRTINLSSNSLSYLPKEIFQIFRKTLINLNLQGNRFESLQRNSFLRSLQQLRILDLSGNRLKMLWKENFRGLKRLKTLIVRENQLTHLSYATFRHCRMMTTLDLSDNQISSIDFNAFHLLNYLKILLLNNNPLGQRSLSNHLLKPLTNLQYLDLENTQLENLSSFLFVHNQRLRSIKLRRNTFHLNMTLKRTFCKANSLIEIDLVNTNIQTLDICTYHQLPSLRRLYLMSNPLDCTCDLFYLKYGDIYRLLSVDGNGFEQLESKVDMQLNRWISRPELYRHVEKAFVRGDLTRLPIDLSMFARCAKPQEWNGYEINNITGVYSQCRYRWMMIEHQCRNYCQEENFIETSLNSSTGSRFWISFFVCFLPVIISQN